MISLARSGLIHDWRRFLSAVFALAFSALLIHAQIGLALGFFYVVADFLQKSSADLWVTDPRMTSLWSGMPLKLEVEFMVRTHPDVIGISTFQATEAELKAEKIRAYSMLIYFQDSRKQDMSIPRNTFQTYATALEEPGTVVLETKARTNLGLRIGDEMEFNGKRAKLIGFTDEYKGVKLFGSEFLIGVCSQMTAAQISDGHLREDGGSLQLKLKDPARLEQVRKELSQMYPGKFRLWTLDELFQSTLYDQIVKSKKDWQLLFSALIAVLIGMVITSQSLRGAILASVRDYAAIRALGVSRRSLGWVVLEQGLWVGVAGLAIGVALTCAVSAATAAIGIPFHVPWWIYLFTVPMVMFTAFCSGLVALRVLYRTQPAELLR